MKLRGRIVVNLTSTAVAESVSGALAVPAWARTASVFPQVLAWSGAAAALRDTAEGRAEISDLSPAVTFSDNTPAREIDVRTSDRLYVQTTTGNASADTDGEFVVVFSD